MIYGACAVTGAICFVLGVVFGKSVQSEVEAIKNHVTAEIAKLREEFVAKIKG